MNGKRVTIGIDATNVRAGGGITYLRGLFANRELAHKYFDRFVVWGGPWVEEINLPAWVEARVFPELGGSVWDYDFSALRRLHRQLFTSSQIADELGCALVYFPGGAIPLGLSAKARVAVISRNLLPFCPKEILRYGFSFGTVRLLLLRRWYKWSMRRANGVIFLTRFSQRVITAQTKIRSANAVIPHGITEVFRQPTRADGAQALLGDQPFRWVYTSTLAPYKHQDKVAAALRQLHDQNFNVSGVFCGHGSTKAVSRFTKVLNRLDPAGKFLQYIGGRDHDDLPRLYRTAHGFVFASTCENMPHILLEAMASGLPIVCSSAGPMPEILQDGGILCDVTNVSELAMAMRHMMESAKLREQFQARARACAALFSWERCATETWGFLQSLV